MFRFPFPFPPALLLGVLFLAAPDDYQATREAFVEQINAVRAIAIPSAAPLLDVPPRRRGGACPARPSRTRDPSGPPSQSHLPPRGLDREDHVIKFEYRGLAPRGTVVRGGRPKGRPYGAKGTVVDQGGVIRRSARPSSVARSSGAGGPKATPTARRAPSLTRVASSEGVPVLPPWHGRQGRAAQRPPLWREGHRR
jgi:hypothetical protein